PRRRPARLSRRKGRQSRGSPSALRGAGAEADDAAREGRARARARHRPLAGPDLDAAGGSRRVREALCMRTNTMRALLLGIAMALLAIAASAQSGEKPSVPVPQDLLAVLTLRGKPCGSIASYERKADSDYLVTCSDGHKYRVFIAPGDRVVIEDR